MLTNQILARDSMGLSSIALTFRRDRDPNGIEKWSYDTLRQHVESDAHWLKSNVGRAALVAIRMEPDGDSIAALLAAEKCGFPAVLLPASLPPDETSSLLESLHPAAVFARQASKQLGPSNWMSEQDSYPPPSAIESVSDKRAVEGFVGQLTSGSLGPSRLAVRTAPGVVLELKSVASALGLRESDRVLCASSIAHSYGLIGGVLGPLLHGSHVALAGNPDDAGFLAQRFDPTIVFGLSSTYSGFLSKRVDRSALSDSRYIFSAGAPLPKGLFIDFLSRFEKPIRQDYGTTETGTISIDCEEEACPETVGKPLPHMELRITQPRNGEAVKNGQGEICVRSAAIAAFLLQGGRRIPSTEVDGWYYTGDAGQISNKGSLKVGSRLREPLVLDGLIIHLERVEEDIRALPGVTDVVAVPTETGTAVKIKAMIVAPGTNIKTIEQLTRNQVPNADQFLSVELVDELPRSPAGKILQKYLVREAEARSLACAPRLLDR
jgi:3-hydroxy-4-methylanthranilate adenylyltransferase